MSRRIPQLDALRGFAILVVIFHNQTPKFPSLHLGELFANGWMGVDLFFVLSGFLITGILLDTKQSEGYFKNFYARRCLRIWPLYYSVLLFMFVLVPTFRPSEAAEVFARSSPWWAYLLYLQNFLVPMSTSATGPLGVSWSLAIEEQFYLVWPLVVWLCPRPRLTWLAALVVILSPALRLFLSFHDVNLYSNVFCRLDGLMAGSLLAAVTRQAAFRPSSFVNVAWVSLVVALPLAFVAEARDARWIGFSLVAVAAASLLYVSLFSTNRWLQMVLSNRFLVHTGTISYGLYLLHKIPFNALESFHVNRPLLELAVGLLGAYLAAEISWNLLEKPFLSMRRFFEPALAPEGRRDSRLALAQR